MSKLLFWAAVILVGLLVMRLLARHSSPRHRRAKPPPRHATPKRVQTMVRCAHCGLHLPSAEAVHRDGHTWCSQDHANAGVRAQP